jgi:hypothetical protein
MTTRTWAGSPGRASDGRGTTVDNNSVEGAAVGTDVLVGSGGGMAVVGTGARTTAVNVGRRASGTGDAVDPHLTSSRSKTTRAGALKSFCTLFPLSSMLRPATFVGTRIRCGLSPTRCQSLKITLVKRQTFKGGKPSIGHLTRCEIRQMYRPEIGRLADAPLGSL